MEIDTEEVLNAASTKWNFIKFEPGLVGGHCIGVDPYYLTYKAETLGYHPEIILDYGKVTISLISHDIKKITERDLDLAKLIDKVYSSYLNEDK